MKESSKERKKKCCDIHNYFNSLVHIVREIQVCIATLQMKFWLDFLDQSNSPVLKLILPSPMVSPNDYLHILAQCLQLRNAGNVL